MSSRTTILVLRRSTYPLPARAAVPLAALMAREDACCFEPGDQGGRTDAARVAVRGLANGLLLNAPGPDCLRFMPALNVSPAEIDATLALLDEVLAY